jgi:D-inositol-3-phosphate glycosyltransferase
VSDPSPECKTELQVALLTGCQDRSYAFGLAMALSSKGVQVDIVGNDRVDSPEFHHTPNVAFLNLGGIQSPEDKFLKKLFHLSQYYARLIRYITLAKPKLLHILWNSKFEYFDRTLLMIYCKLLGKKVALTAHNVNRRKRDSSDSVLNRLTLRIQYRLTDRIFVHTEKMRSELIEDFGVRAEAITQIPFGINIAVPNTELTPALAKKMLGIESTERTILFFGRIVPYKGLEYLLTAFHKVSANHPNYRLVIAGEPMKGYEEYMQEIHRMIDQGCNQDRIIQKLEFISDEATELYFKAADVLVLPYKDIFQSGVLFLGYSFGLPAIAADVGSFSEDILRGTTGFLYSPADSMSLADTLEEYFNSELYKDLDRFRLEIREHANERHSWETVSKLTRSAYEELASPKVA